MNRNKETDGKEKFYFLGNNYETQFIEPINATSQKNKNQKRNILLFNDIINIKNFHPNLLKLDKKFYQEFHVYYFCYITINKFAD